MLNADVTRTSSFAQSRRGCSAVVRRRPASPVDSNAIRSTTPRLRASRSTKAPSSHRLDPNGRLRKYYDVVTYGRGGIQKVESAAVNFDRKACGACGCKAFNATKSKLIKTAITPAQMTAYEAYKPVLEQLKKTDFVGAAKGAQKGDDSWVPQGI